MIMEVMMKKAIVLGIMGVFCFIISNCPVPGVGPAPPPMPDGVYDTSFNSGGFGVDLNVDSLAVQADGKILIGGGFTMYNGQDVPDCLIRLNADGTLDESFNNGGSGLDETVNVIKVQSDGKILIGGEFTTYNGVNVPDHIIRLNADGSHDSTFNNGASGANSNIHAILVLGDGKVLIGGSFSHYNGADVPDGIIRLNEDGTHDNTFNNGGSGANNDVKVIRLQSDGKILIGGWFGVYNGITYPDFFTRLNADGTIDDTFNNGGIGPNHQIYGIGFQSDGKIIIGGWFDKYNDEDVPRGVIRLHN
jgi:uncharacterized delta-60 repeat protein